MKTQIIFQDRLPFLNIIVHKDQVEDFKASIKQDGVIISNEYTPQTRGDENYCFLTENISIYLLEKLQARSGIYATNITFSYSENIRVSIKLKTEGAFIDYGVIEFKHINKDGSMDWNDMISIWSRKKSFSDKHISSYEINWSCIGSTSVEDTEEFSQGLALAVTLAKEWTEQFIATKNNPIVI